MERYLKLKVDFKEKLLFLFFSLINEKHLKRDLNFDEMKNIFLNDSNQYVFKKKTEKGGKKDEMKEKEFEEEDNCINEIPYFDSFESDVKSNI